VSFNNFVPLDYQRLSPVDVVTQYSDVKGSDWYYDYVYSIGNIYPYWYTIGEPGYYFMPNSNARRQDVAAAIMKLARKPLEEYPEVDCASMFSDFNQVEDYNKEYIELAVKYGLLKGYDNGTLNPNGTVSRAETVIMLQRGLALDGSNLSTFAYTGKWVSGATGDETYVEMTINSTHFGNPIKMAIQCSDVTINASGTLWNGQVAFSG